MELTSQQRAFLRSSAQTMKPVVMIGKDGESDEVVLALGEALTHHELVKVRFQSHKDETSSIAASLAQRTASTLIAVTGFTAVYYRQADKKEERRYNLKTLEINW